MELSQYARELAAACRDAGAWVTRNSELVRNEQEGLLKELRRAGRMFGRCARAADRKMCAGVFGPSQAGKSYLISALARDTEGNLQARFGAEMHDFISEINPEGGKESTGLVTRFTMTRPESLPEGHPVQIRLLSETDLVKIIANTWFADCEHKEEPQSDIKTSLDALAGRAQKATDSPIDLDALEDLREYLVRDFRAKARVQELERSFWEQALAIGPHLGLEDRILLYALIWDETTAFTALLRRLLQALEALGHSDTAFAPLGALIPREGSIIDVATLANLESESGGSDETLDIVSAGGRHASLPRAVVTALTAELSIVMDKQPAPYFEHTDLLDFPGYRSRYKFDDVRRELEKPGLLREMFLRGKVAYLFQRYCAERELTSMLLCIGPSNQEVQDLPGVINDWICSTHGERPEERAGRQVSLFFVLTKFDMEFEQKKGAPSVEIRWDNRLHASLLDFFGKQHDWPHEWDGVHAFNNMFLLRNPNFRFDAILEYDEAGREKGIRPQMQAYVNELENAFMHSRLVAAHFRNPRLAWDAAMKLNDGGISHIRESLSPLCNPEIKRAQLLQGIATTRDALHQRLRTFYQTDDREEMRRQKQQFVNTLFARLGQLEKSQQRLGLLLRSFTVSDADICDLHPEAFRRFLALREEGQPEAAPAAPADDFLDNPFESVETPAAPAESTAPPGPGQDEAAFFASYIESSWVGRLHELADDPALQKYFMLPGQDFSGLVGELATGVARMGLSRHMAALFRKAAAYANTRKESIVRQQASIAAHCLNSYVNWLGFDPLTRTESERSIVVQTREGSVNVPLFQPLPPVQGWPQLAESRSGYTALWFRDWLYALRQLVMDNVNFDGDQSINVEENAALGGILRQLADSGRGAA